MTAASTGNSSVDVDIEADPAREGEGWLDEVYHLLQNSRRRNVLRYLRDAESAVEMRDLVDQVAAWEHDTTTEDVGSTERKRVYVTLYQVHLPKLDENGAIEYDKDRGLVAPTDRTDWLASFLDPQRVETETVREDAVASDDWPTYHLLATLVGGVVLSLTMLDVGGFAVVPDLAAGGLVIGVLVLLSLAQVVERQGVPHLN